MNLVIAWIPVREIRASGERFHERTSVFACAAQKGLVPLVKGGAEREGEDEGSDGSVGADDVGFGGEEGVDYPAGGVVAFAGDGLGGWSWGDGEDGRCLLGWWLG